MPEAPEVKYLVGYLSKGCKNRMLQHISIMKGRYAKHGPPMNFDKFVKELPLQLIDISKKGKVIIFHFDKDWYIVSRLGLTGWWFINNDMPEWSKGTANIVFQLDGKNLYYHDTLSYGTLKFIHGHKNMLKEFRQLAPEVETIPLSELLERVAMKRNLGEKQLDNVLMDQKAIFSGIGNYLKSEILYKAKLSPKRLVKSITPDDWNVFLQAARKVMKRQGNTVGSMNKYMNMMCVYMKEKDPHGNKIQKYKSKNGRTTYWVPALQK